MRELEAESVDAIITDPPYSSGTRREASKTLTGKGSMCRAPGTWFGSDSLTTDGFQYLMRAVSVEAFRTLKPGGHFLSFIDWRMLPHLMASVESADLRKIGVLVWDKTYYSLGHYFRNQHEFIVHFSRGKGAAPQRRDVGNVLQCKPVRNGVHPTEKPVDLLDRILSVVAPPDAVVLDPFMGSGSTGVAALHTGRRFIGIEREETYFKIAEKRIYAAHAEEALK
jgi:site-specific DNA-methyltransferase (adenine-specific)